MNYKCFDMETINYDICSSLNTTMVKEGSPQTLNPAPFTLPPTPYPLLPTPYPLPPKSVKLYTPNP
jgi:hypothetical protein